MTLGQEQHGLPRGPGPILGSRSAVDLQDPELKCFCLSGSQWGPGARGGPLGGAALLAWWRTTVGWWSPVGETEAGKQAGQRAKPSLWEQPLRSSPQAGPEESQP